MWRTSNVFGHVVLHLVVLIQAVIEVAQYGSHLGSLCDRHRSAAAERRTPRRWFESSAQRVVLLPKPTHHTAMGTAFPGFGEPNCLRLVCQATHKLTNGARASQNTLSWPDAAQVDGGGPRFLVDAQGNQRDRQKGGASSRRNGEIREGPRNANRPMRRGALPPAGDTAGIAGRTLPMAWCRWLSIPSGRSSGGVYPRANNCCSMGRVVVQPGRCRRPQKEPVGCGRRHQRKL